MDRLRKTFSVRSKRKQEFNEAMKPQQWIEDEKKIKEGSCSFHVKYLGNIEVFESRGMQVCEEALKALRKAKKVQRAILFISGDALRVSDEISKHLIVDQTIEKVSFCAPDRGHEKGFAYICRDGATRRWMCHAFLAVKESGERLSHAVGCAFAICLEKKQKRERDAVQKICPSDEGFVRMSSFRQASLAERLLDPQSAIVVEPPRCLTIENEVSQSNAIVPFGANASPPSIGAIPRPHATPSLLERQTSLRLFPKLQESSPFKQNLSLRINQSNSLVRASRMRHEEAIPEEHLSSPDSVSKSVTAALQPSIMSFPPSPPTLVPSALPVPSSVVALNGAANIFASTSSSTGGDSFSDRLFEGSDLGTTQVIVDPFSAAPFHPETIQQHYQSQMSPPLLVQNKPVPTLAQKNAAFKPQNTDWSTFDTTPPELVESKVPTFQSISSSSAETPLAARSPPTAVPPDLTFTPKPSTVQNSSEESEDSHWNYFPSWLSPRALVLPPEQPDLFADPFDVGWADRATAFVNYQLTNCSMSSNPQLCHSDDVVSSSTNPFLALNVASAQTSNSSHY